MGLRAMTTAEFRFYEELNDHLPAARRKRAFSLAFDGTPAVKDVIEALDVPHTEIDLILVNGRSVRFSHRLRGGERVAVYPVFERISAASHAVCACSDSILCIQRISMTTSWLPFRYVSTGFS